MTIEMYLVELCLLYASGMISGLAIMLVVVWVMEKTGHDVEELWNDEKEED